MPVKVYITEKVNYEGGHLQYFWWKTSVGLPIVHVEDFVFLTIEGAELQGVSLKQIYNIVLAEAVNKDSWPVWDLWRFVMLFTSLVTNYFKHFSHTQAFMNYFLEVFLFSNPSWSVGCG